MRSLSDHRSPSYSAAALAGLLLGTWGAAGCGAGDQDTRDPAHVQLVTRALVDTSSVDYKLPATVMTDVLADRSTELWGHLYRPQLLVTGKRYPVLIFLHGNHATCGTGANPRVDDRCDYTAQGVCPAGYAVVENHLGYDYAARALAEQEYIVVSINANRGITCGAGIPGDPGLNLARGRLVLKHLEKLSQWDRAVEAPPAGLENLPGHLDLQHLGLMGHSRGGEGVRAAYAQYRDAGSAWPDRIATPLGFQGIFEIGPVDGQTARVLDAVDVRWNVLLPLCDGDVSNLQGVRVLDRMLLGRQLETFETSKSSFAVWGANHNFYNSQWQESDSTGCTGHLPIFSTALGTTGSEAQRETGRLAMLTFFLGSVGPEPDSASRRLFNPLHSLPPALTAITRVDRGYTAAADDERSARFEDFDGEAPLSSWGLPGGISQVAVTHAPLPEHDPRMRGGVLGWAEGGGTTYWQTNATVVGQGLDLRAYRTLDLRIDRGSAVLNPTTAPTDFSIQLVNGDDTLSEKVAIASFVDLTGPAGGPFENPHAMLQTARIPLGTFAGANLAQVRGVRLTFDRTPRGKIFLASIRAHAGDADDELAPPPPPPPPPPPAEPPPTAEPAPTEPPPPTATVRRVTTGNRILGVRSPPRTPAGRTAGAPAAEIELASALPFPVRDALLTLHVGAVEVQLSRYPDPGELGRIVFSLTSEQYAALRAGDAMKVSFGPGSSVEWDFGPFTP